MEIIEKVRGTKGCGCKGAKCDGTIVGCTHELLQNVLTMYHNM